MTDNENKKNNKVISFEPGTSIDPANHFHPLSAATESGRNLNSLYTKEKESELQKNSKEIKFKLYQKFLGELFGTTILVYQSCGSSVFQKDKLYVGVLASSFTVLFIVYVFINISGSHFNPAVSFAIYLKGAITLKEFFFYILAQVIGAFLGCCFIALSRKGKFDE